jgi:two-component system response regulator DesR
MISIVIAEDQNMLRKAMIQLIEFHDDLKVIDDFDNGIDALQSINSSAITIEIILHLLSES